MNIPDHLPSDGEHQELSPRQRETFEAIQKHIRDHGLPPTIREIMAHMNVAYPRGVQRHLEALEKKGYITRDSRSRGITLAERFRQAATDLADLAENIIKVPLLGRIPAGGPMLAQENIEDWVTLPTDLTKGKRDVFILRTQGDSMIGAGIFDGDLLIVQPQETANHGEIVVALIGDDATVKRFVQKDNLAYLKAENPKYSNIYPDQDWHIQGKVTAVVRQNV